MQEILFFRPIDMRTLTWKNIFLGNICLYVACIELKLNSSNSGAFSLSLTDGNLKMMQFCFYH